MSNVARRIRSTGRLPWWDSRVMLVLSSLLSGPRTVVAQLPIEAPSLPRTVVAVTAHFELHSDPWVNLHHFLYQWGREDEGLGQGRQHVTVAERSSVTALSDSERRAWDQAVAFYRRALAGRNHLDDEMLEQKRDLLMLAGDPRAQPPDVVPGVAAALTVAMPVYWTRWWPAHDQANRSWAARVAPLLRRHEADYVELTRRLFDARWPSGRWRVDVSAYANPRAGYTADGHIVIHSTDTGNQDLYGLETIFHESLHIHELGRSGRVRLSRIVDSAGVEAPPNLWHALIFATAGEFVRAASEGEGLPAHTPYFLREGFDAFRGWSEAVRAAQEYWVPVIRGERTVDEGLAALVLALEGR